MLQLGKGLANNKKFYDKFPSEYNDIPQNCSSSWYPVQGLTRAETNVDICTIIIYILKNNSGYNLPRFWEVTWVRNFSPALGRNITEVEPTELRQDEVYIEVSGEKSEVWIPSIDCAQVYINWLYLIFLYLTPISILTVFNIRIYRWDENQSQFIHNAF